MTNEQNAPAYEATRDKVAKAIADAIGHGMAEKCYTHADAAISVLSSPPAAGDAVACEFCGGRGFTDDGHVEWDGQVVSAPEGCVECDGRGSVPAAAPKPAAPREDALTDLSALVDRFLAWKLPESVCADPCATQHGRADRIGTNLLTATEAGEMFRHVLSDFIAPFGDVWEAYKSWPADVRAKLSMHDLRRMNGWQGATVGSGRDVIAKALLIAADDKAALTDAVRELVAKWKGGASSNDASRKAPGVGVEMDVALKTEARVLRRCADELEALTHPGHKHAQEDAAQEGAIPARVYYSVEHDNFYCNDTLKGMGTPFYMKWHARRREFPTLRSEGDTE